MSHRVTNESTGRSFEAAEGESILDAALNQGHNFPYGCRNGFCGECKGRVVAGEVRYPEGFEPQSLRPQEQAEGYALLCKAMACGDLGLEVKEVSQAEELPVVELDATVDRVERLTDDVVRMYLRLPESETLRFLAGQYINFILADGRRRAFSLANAPHNAGTIELHLRHVEGGTFTEHVFGGMTPGETLRIEGPMGQFYLREDSEQRIILVAGGTGFAPIKAIVEHALEEKTNRPMHLYWGVRDQKDLYLDALARSWAEEHLNFSYTPVLSEASAQSAWDGRTGFVHQAVAEDYADLSGFDVYMAGPPVMVNAARDAFAEKGLPGDRLFYDSFEIAGKTEKK